MSAGHRRARVRVLLGTAAVCAGVVMVGGCSPLPEEGPVEIGAAPGPTPSAAPFDFNPPGPVAGADRREIVAGFLRALQATPVGTQAAEEFLTAEAVESWRPDRRTIVYRGNRLAAGGEARREVAVRLDASFELDRSGRWTGPSADAAGGAARTLRFRLAREDDQWRIAALPDAMVIPESHFEARYREYHLPFFDATGSVLVPEPVYLPWGVQAPTLLVRGLLAGPGQDGRAVERTFFPKSTRMGVGVPVREDGVAEVPLSRHVTEIGEEQLQLAMAQLAWTLRQVPEVSKFRVTVDGTPVELPDAPDTVDVDVYSRYAPWIESATTDLFGVSDDAVVQLVGESEIAAAALPGRLRDPRSLGVDLAGQRFALVSAGGDRVVVVPRAAEDGGTPTTEQRGTDLLRPMWDHTGRLLVVDRRARGPVLLVSHFGRSRVLPLPALGAGRVVAVSLSRDGTRLVAVLDAPAGTGPDRLVLMRVVRQASGSPVRLTPPRTVPTATPLRRVRDVGWRDPTTVAVLIRSSRTTSEVVTASVDGSSALLGLDPVLDVLFERAATMAASPTSPPALYVASPDGRLHALDVQGRWDLDAVDARLRLPTFVG